MCEQSKMLDQNIKTVDHSTCPIQSRLLVSAVVRLHPAGQWLKDVYHQLQQQHQISTPPTVTARAPRTQGNMINIAAIATAMTTNIPDLGHTPGSATRSASAAVHGIRRLLCGKALTGLLYFESLRSHILRGRLNYKQTQQLIKWKMMNDESILSNCQYSSHLIAQDLSQVITQCRIFCEKKGQDRSASSIKMLVKQE